MSKTPTQGERADFRGFCERASDSQLDEIIAKEKAANRKVYASIAEEVQLLRGPTT